MIDVTKIKPEAYATEILHTLSRTPADVADLTDDFNITRAELEQYIEMIRVRGVKVVVENGEVWLG